MNNILVSPPNPLISGVNIKWATYSLQNSSTNGQSVKKRKFTGLPKGKTLEEKGIYAYLMEMFKPINLT